MSSSAIYIEGLGKRYRIGELQKYKALRDTLADGLYAPVRAVASMFNGRRPSSAGRDGYIWALKDISFEVKRGEVLGIIGGNGAGKSTLLKILSRITKPSEGYVRIHGRVASLLEVGTGFHPELTGRENVYLNGAILGMRKAEIDRKFDEIIAFAEVQRFVDTPVKYYSSGMYVRLAFAVAAHLEPEILLVDEVLAVGDAAFQKKCLGRMGEVAKGGRTVLFVSHHIESIQRLCHQCILLTQGEVALNGATQDVVTSYLTQQRGDIRSNYHLSNSEDSSYQGRACLLEAELLNAAGAPSHFLHFGEPFTIHMLWQHWSAIEGVAYAIRFYDLHNRLLFAVNSINTELQIESKGIHNIDCRFDENVLIPGEYIVSIGCYIRPHTVVHVIDTCFIIKIINSSYRLDNIFDIFGEPIFALNPSWRSK
jgi:lipopolysaccharide transport system ATP-binding protein